MKKYFTLIITLILPSFFLIKVLRILGYKVGRNVRIGFSILKLDNLILGDNTKIGHFNLILINSLKIKENGSIKNLNIFKGPFDFEIESKGRVANKNYVSRAPLGVTFDYAKFVIGYNSNITSNHFIDLTQSVTLGDNTVLGGRNSQIWTHGYIHKESGDERFRVDGSVEIGNNVYLGSMVLINPGVVIHDAISIGSGSVVSKKLVEKGMYVNTPLRFLHQDFELLKNNLEKVQNKNLVENVYIKNSSKN